MDGANIYNNNAKLYQCGPMARFITNLDDTVDFIRSGNHAAHHMNKTRAPGWHGAVEELAAKAGVRTPNVYRVPSKQINIMAIPGTGKNPGNILITDGFMQTCKTHHTSPHPSKESLMFVSHELGHMRQGASAIIGIRLLPFIFPLASMAGLYIYDHTVKEGKSLTISNMGEAISRTFRNLKIQLHLQKPEPGSTDDEHAATITWKENALDAGHYLLAGALGFGVGLGGTYTGMRHLEFDADRTAVKLMGDKDGYIAIMQKFHEDAYKQLMGQLKNMPQPATVEKATVIEHIKTQAQMFLLKVFHAHPTMEERAAFLNKTFGDRVKESRNAAAAFLQYP